MGVQRQTGSGLRDGLDDEHTGHHRCSGEVPRKEPLVTGDVLFAHDAVLADFCDPVDKQKRRAVGDDLLDALTV